MKRARIVAASSLALTIVDVLAENASLCLDNEDERADLAVALVVAMMDRPEAVALRAAFAKAPTDGSRLISFHEKRGDEQSQLVECGYRLAGGK